jgi:hypothetical protein
MPYRARYKVLLTMKMSKASLAAKAKECIDLSLDEDNVQLAKKISVVPRKRKAVPASLAASVESASGGDSFAAGGMVSTSLRPTLFECTPPHSFALFGGFEAEHEEEKIVKNSGAKVNADIADMIHAHGMSFSLSESPRFQRMLRLAKFAPPRYEPPRWKLVGERLLAVNFKEYHDRILERLALQARTLGLSLLGDGATVKRMPLVNMLSAGGHQPAGVLEIAECTGHIQGGGKKYAGFIAGSYLPHMKKIDPDKQLIDCVFFDGASNVQKAGNIMQVHYPRVMVLHGVEYVVYLFFKDLSNIQVVKHHIVRHRFIYCVFGFCAMYSLYSLFQRHYGHLTMGALLDFFEHLIQDWQNTL